VGVEAEVNSCNTSHAGADRGVVGVEAEMMMGDQLMRGAG
jgi:hypothetical protein